MGWRPLGRGKPEVEGVHPEFSGLLRVRLQLTDSVPEEWVYFFLHPTGVGISLSMHPPEISGRTIRIIPPDDELERYIRHVDERIRAANGRYEEEILPRLQALAEREAAVEAERNRRLKAVRSTVDTC